MTSSSLPSRTRLLVVITPGTTILAGPLPFFDQPIPPAMPGRLPYENEAVTKWTAAIDRPDGFIIVAPEYNYGPSGVLNNAIDWVYPEWNRKQSAS